MEGKKEIKISLGTVICICIIIVLIMGGIFLALENTKLKDELRKKEDFISEKKSNNVAIESKDENTHNQMAKENNVEKLKNDKHFTINNIEEKTEGYVVVVNMLDDSRKELSKEEFDKILKNGTFTFRGAEWNNISKGRKSATGEIFDEDYYFAKSGKYEIAICYDEENEAYYFNNVAGAKSEGLADYSGDIVEFEIKSIDNVVLSEYNNSKDGYSECIAEIANGEVTNIKFVLSENR